MARSASEHHGLTPVSVQPSEVSVATSRSPPSAAYTCQRRAALQSGDRACQSSSRTCPCRRASRRIASASRWGSATRATVRSTAPRLARHSHSVRVSPCIGSGTQGPRSWATCWTLLRSGGASGGAAARARSAARRGSGPAASRRSETASVGTRTSFGVRLSRLSVGVAGVSGSGTAAVSASAATRTRDASRGRARPARAARRR